MKIRAATVSDSAEWLRMRRALWPDPGGGHGAEIAAYFSAAEPMTRVLIAEAPDGAVCGFLEAGTRPYAEGCVTSPVAYVEGWWVDPGHRRQGVGAGLMAAAESWAASKGLTELASDAELSNKLSRRAHRSLGFDEIEKQVCFRKSLKVRSRHA